MATILNQAKETLKTCRKVKKEAENMYVYKNDKRAMRDITTAENVKDAASEAMGKIELTMSGLKKTKKNNEKYVAEYKNMKVSLCDGVHICSTHPVSVGGFLRCSYHLSAH